MNHASTTRPTDPRLSPWRQRLHEIVFEADTPAGKAFDIILIVAILLSVIVVMLDSVRTINQRYATILLVAEWSFTILFTIEYALRLIAVHKKTRYIFSFYGLVDLLSILPTYLSVLIPGAHELMVIRSLRLLRIFRIFKLARFVQEAGDLRHGLWRSRAKLTVFIIFVTIVVVLMGTIMHLIEGDPVRFPDTPYTSIPESIYWAIITMTTVGFGDITPQTPLGKALTAITVLIGYAMIVVPTSIVTADILEEHRSKNPISTQACPACGRDGHTHDARHCKHCGARL